MISKASHFVGLEGIQTTPIIARLLQEADKPGRGVKAIVVTPTYGMAVSLEKTLPFFLGGIGGEVYLLPEADPPFLKTDARSREVEGAFLRAMTALASPGAAVVVCPVSAAIQDVCGPEAFGAAWLELSPGAGPQRDELVRYLAGLDYRRVPYSEGPGEFSARGDIVDVFPVNRNEPLRVSFFDTMLESIRVYDPETQKSTVTGVPYPVVVTPAKPPAAEGLTIIDWADEGSFFCIDPERTLRSLELREMEAMQDLETLIETGDAAGDEMDGYRGLDFWKGLSAHRRPHIFTPYVDAGAGFKPGGQYETIEYEAKYTAAFYGQLELLSAELKRYFRLGYTVTVAAATQKRLESLREFAEQEGLANNILFVTGELAAGFEIAGEKRVWLWDGDIFKTGKKSRRAKLSGHDKISAFTDIEKGDYIVHEKHGIGIFKGIATIEANGSRRDYLCIAYTGKDMLYIPVEQMDRVQKYVGGGERKPRISRLGSEDWSRTKSRVRAEVEEYAAELIKLAAERKLAPGFAFSPDTVWLKDFEDRFPFEPTPDQMRCFEAVRRDMENPWPMDRLICGDVGYGKTEVALRAVFKCVQDGKQAAVLVPTTILASQHYRTFSERFIDFPVRVGMLSRFNSARERKEILDGLKNGGLDIVIGTHALLSAKVGFKDLGLLIIDEEQRFGVKHKEKIRTLRAGIDVLTLTATPIPRTLNMSLLGIKDMELIEDPPEDRYPIRTFVTEERPDVITESIKRELDREGQVYIVFNRVTGIERIAEQIRTLAPQARLVVCHAQMNERMIEEVMQGFYEKEYDVLLSTSIIESGLDIPNVNTIIILDSDRLGLTQLYQLRGRVGRTNRIAFAYLMYRRDKVLTESAEKRLRTIREFTEFGSGFKVAMKDLEIRGAGNLLGVSQHGHMASVGYEMYCKLMDEAVTRLAGNADVQVSPENECRVELPTSAIIPSGYIDDEIVKLQAYKRISFVCDEASKKAIIEELHDRFGPAPASVLALVYAAWLRHLGEKAGLAEVRIGAGRAELLYHEAPAELMKRVFKASELAHREGAAIEVDVKQVPKLKLLFPPGVSDEARFELTIAVLSVLADTG